VEKFRSMPVDIITKLLNKKYFEIQVLKISSDKKLS